MLKKLTLLCILYSTCPRVYVNKHLLCPTYGRVPTKGYNYVGFAYCHGWFDVGPPSFVLKALHLPTIYHLLCLTWLNSILNIPNSILKVNLQFFLAYLLKSRSYLQKGPLRNTATIKFVVDPVSINSLPSFYIEVTYTGKSSCWH